MVKYMLAMLTKHRNDTHSGCLKYKMTYRGTSRVRFGFGLNLILTMWTDYNYHFGFLVH